MEEILKGKRKKLEEDTGIYSHQQRLNERALEKVM